MDNKSNKTTTTAIYSFQTDEGEMASIDLKGYRAICTVTKQPKQFHHTYLANMIQKKFNGNFDTFCDTYVSREGLAQKNLGKRQEQIKDKIDRLYNQIRLLKTERDTLNEIVPEETTVDTLVSKTHEQDSIKIEVAVN